MKKSKSKSKSKSKTKTPPSTKLGNHLAPSIEVTNQIAMKMLSINEGYNKCCISEEEISRRRMLRRKYYGSSSDEEEKEVKEEEKKEQEWTLERIKKYYYTGIHDHSECEKAEKERQLKSGFYYELEMECGDNLIERLASGQFSIPEHF